MIEKLIEVMGSENVKSKDSPIGTFFAKYPVEEFESSDELYLKWEIICDLTSDLCMKQINPFYTKIGIHALPGIYKMLVEPLKNATFHGGNALAHNVEFSVLLTDKLLVASYFDEGDYFGREDIKHAYENRLKINESHIVENQGSTKLVGYGRGNMILRDCADILLVDINSRTLYVGIETSNKHFFQKR